jgi:tRNA-splicing ligase RtcB
MGQDYWALMTLAGEYAYAGREWVARKVVSCSVAASSSSCTTITTSRGAKQHDGDELVVVRKGATPAFPGQKGFVGGSMGDDAVIVQGAHADNDKLASCSVRRCIRQSTAPDA